MGADGDWIAPDSTGCFGKRRGAPEHASSNTRERCIRNGLATGGVLRSVTLARCARGFCWIARDARGGSPHAAWSGAVAGTGWSRFTVCFARRLGRTEIADADRIPRDGWWYTVRLPADGCRVAVFFTDARDAACARARSSAGFLEMLGNTEHINQLIAGHGYVLRDAPHTAAANTTSLEQYAGDQWLAAGDAAMACDPLSSQGILNALYSGFQAAGALEAALGGNLQALPEYGQLMDRVQTAYRQNLRFYYGVERRWPEAEFWAGVNVFADGLARSLLRARVAVPCRGGVCGRGWLVPCSGGVCGRGCAVPCGGGPFGPGLGVPFGPGPGVPFG